METNLAAARAHMARLSETFDRVVAWVFARGSLRQFPRVVQYVGKENGGLGWEDSYQNLLVERLIASQWMKKESDTIFLCVPDNTRWRRSTDEWRMLAFKETLTLVREDAPTAPLPELGAPCTADVVFFSEDFFRTRGFDPPDAKRTDLDGIVRYLTTLADGDFLDRAVSGNSQGRSVWRAIRRAFGG